MPRAAESGFGTLNPRHPHRLITRLQYMDCCPNDRGADFEIANPYRATHTYPSPVCNHESVRGSSEWGLG